MRKQYQAVSAAEAVKVIKSGDHVHISSVSSVPQCLVKALCDRGRAGELKNVYIHHLHTEGRYCAELIEDGACLQMGIGSIPNAILSCLHNHKNIGISTVSKGVSSSTKTLIRLI